MWGSVFPGQGSQQQGMGKFLVEEFKDAKEVFEESSDSISFDLKKLCFEGTDADLALTENTQPALVTASSALDRVLQNQFGFKPQFGAGHSVGEFSAMVSAKAVSVGEAVAAVRKRGQFMQEAVPVGQGGMLAILGAADEDILKLCAWVEKTSGFTPLEPANFNSPGQVVLSGSAKAIAWLQKNFNAEEAGLSVSKIKMIPLKVSAPFHCSMMKPAQEKMAVVLGNINFQEAKFPIVQNVHAHDETNPSILCDHLVTQISHPVLWVQCVQRLKNLGITKLVEVGTGQVLKGLNKKIAPEIPVFNINSIEDLKNLEKELRT